MTSTIRASENAIKPRRYTITELLVLRKTLPYVACPLKAFKPDAWRENLVKANVKSLLADERYRSDRLKPSTTDHKLPFASHLGPSVVPAHNPLKVHTASRPPAFNGGPPGLVSPVHQRVPQQQVPFGDQSVPDFASPERRRPPELGKFPITYPVASRLSSLAAQRSPMNPTGQPENRGFQQQQQQQQQDMQQYVHLYGAGGMEFMEGAPTMRATSFAGIDPRAYAAYAAQQQTLRALQAMERLNLGGRQQMSPTSPTSHRTPFDMQDYGGLYGNVPASPSAYSGMSASQGFVPGGTLKTAPTTGLSPTHEYTGINWDTGLTSPASPQQQRFDKWSQPVAGPSKAAYYDQFKQQQQEPPTSNKENFFAGQAAYQEQLQQQLQQQYTAKNKQREVSAMLQEPPPQIDLLRADKKDQLAYIQYMMSRTPSGSGYPNIGQSSAAAHSPQRGVSHGGAFLGQNSHRY